MPAGFIDATKQFLQQIDNIAERLCIAVTSTNQQKRIEDLMNSTSLSDMNDQDDIPAGLHFCCKVLEEVPLNKEQYEIFACLRECYKLAACIPDREELEQKSQAEDKEIQEWSLFRAEATRELCRTAERAMKKYSTLTSKTDFDFIPDDIAEDLRSLAFNIERSAQFFENEFAQLKQNIVNYDAEDSSNEYSFAELIRERDQLVSQQRQSMEQFIESISDKRHDVWESSLGISKKIQQSKNKLSEHLAELRQMVAEAYSNNNTFLDKTRNLIHGVGKRASELHQDARTIGHDSAEASKALLSLKNHLINLEHKLLEMILKNQRLRDEQIHENLPDEIDECKKICKRLTKILVAYEREVRGAYENRIEQLKNKCRMKNSDHSAVDQALEQLALREKEFIYVDGECFSSIRRTLKQTEEFRKFTHYVAHHRKKSHILPDYLAKIDNAKNLYELYQVLRMDFSDVIQSNFSLRDNTARLGLHRFFRKGRSTTDNLMNDLTVTLDREVQAFEPADAANDSEYNHASQSQSR